MQKWCLRMCKQTRMRSEKRKTLNALNLLRYAKFKTTLIAHANKTLRERWTKYRAESGTQGNPPAIGNIRRRRPRSYQTLHPLKPRLKLPTRPLLHPNLEDGLEVVLEAVIEGGHREAQAEAEAEGVPRRGKLQPYRLLPLVKMWFLPTPLLSQRALDHPRKRHDPDYSLSPTYTYFTCP